MAGVGSLVRDPLRSIFGIHHGQQELQDQVTRHHRIRPGRSTHGASRSSWRWSLALLLTLACGQPPPDPARFDGFVHVGILHSRTGTMSISEPSAAEGELLAIEEINADGGLDLNGQRIEIIPIEEDGESDWPTFAHRARKLIERDQVAVIFGGWTSASRKALLPVLEEFDHLLFYPIQYEGEECAPNVFYAGATPNQQVEPGLDWLAAQGQRRWFLIGSDYVYPRTANRLVRKKARQLGAEVVGEIYLPLGSRDVTSAIAEIRRALPEGGAIINTLNGDTNFTFFHGLAQSGLDLRDEFKVMSFSIAEEEVSAIGPAVMAGSYAVWHFYHGSGSPESRRFEEAFMDTYGLRRVTSSPAVSAYSMVHLWAIAAETAGSTDIDRVREALPGTVFESPAGRVEITENHHLIQSALIGRVDAAGRFERVADAGVIDPVAFNPLLADDRIETCEWRGRGRGDR
jgi:urea transport system substrate-binding protein